MSAASDAGRAGPVAAQIMRVEAMPIRAESQSGVAQGGIPQHAQGAETAGWAWPAKLAVSGVFHVIAVHAY